MVTYEVRYEATEEAEDDVRVLMSVWREGTVVARLIAEAASDDIADIAESAGVEPSGADEERRHVLGALAFEVARTIEGEPLDRRGGTALPHIVQHPEAAHLLAWARLHDRYPALDPGTIVHRFEVGGSAHR